MGINFRLSCLSGYLPSGIGFPLQETFFGQAIMTSVLDLSFYTLQAKFLFVKTWSLGKVTFLVGLFLTCG